MPPSGAAFDGGTGNSLANAALLGMLPHNQMMVPFFRDCQKLKEMMIPLWCYRGICFHGHVLFGNNDSYHNMKRFSFHLTSCRLLKIGSVYTNLVCLIPGGLAVRALAGDDPQSDKDMAKRLNSGHLLKNWTCFGAMLGQYLGALLVSGWSASRAFTLRESLSNMLQAYYWLLLQTMVSMQNHGKAWSRWWIPIQTLRNLLDLVGHHALSARYWPDSLVSVCFRMF